MSGPWCWEPVPGYQGAGHTCHKKAHHGGEHLANLCGRGHKGGRRARWTNADDLTITGKGTGAECFYCRDSRKRSEHPQVRLVLVG